MPEVQPKSPAKFVRDAEGIARVLGIELYEQRPRRIKQLDALREIIGSAEESRNGFPARDKRSGFWPRSEVVAWGLERIDLSRNCREFTLVAPKKKAALPKMELPKAEKPASGELFESEGGFERTLDLWEEKLKEPEKWVQSPLQLWQLKQLQTQRPHLFARESTDANGENISGGQRGVANWIRNNFTGVVCNQTDISRWMKGEYLPSGCTENFPSYVEAGRYKTAEVRAWVERYLVKQTVGQNLPLNMDYRAAQEKLDYERSQEEYRVWQQSNSNKFVEVEIVERTGASIGSTARTLTREALERQLVSRMGARLDEMVASIGAEMVTRIKELLQAETITVFTDWQARFGARLGELMGEVKKE